MRRALLRSLAPLLVLAAGVACSRAPRVEAVPLVPVEGGAAVAGVPLPTETCGRYFIAAVTFDGRGPYRMVLDTGAPQTVLTPEAARDAGLGRFARSVASGPFRAEGRIPFVERELGHLSRALRTEVDGILGYDVFEGRLLVYDYPRGEVRVAEGRLPRDAPGVVPLSSNRRPRVGARIGGRHVNLLVDTGYSGGLALEDFDALEFAGDPVPVGARMRIDGLHLRRAGRLADDVVLGAFVLETPIAVDAVGHALLGQAVLQTMIVTLDRASGLARFAGPDGEEPGPVRTPPLHGEGLAMLPRDDRYEVVRVFPGTPGERAGLREGDAVTAVDGIPVAERGCPDPGADPRAPRRLTVLRDGVELEVELTPEALVR